jgi:RNA polymerase sigma-70 factor (ECF subfamily)
VSSGSGEGLTDHTVSAAAAGDEAAFATLYVHLQPALRRYATALVGQDADDVTAEAWLHIARDLRTFHGDVDNFRAWTARIVRNRAMDSLRYSSRRPVQATQWDDLLDGVAREDTAAAALEHLSTESATAMISTLPREQAEAVLLRAVVGLDARSAGQILGKSAAAVRVAAHRGLRQLAQRLPAADDARTRVEPANGESA